MAPQIQGTLQWGAKGFSGSGFVSSLTLDRSIPEIEPSNALLFAHGTTLPDELGSCATTPAKPK